MGEPIGKQDQFAAAFGGLKFYEFMPNGFVNVEPVIMKPDSYAKLENNLLMFYLGGTHSASAILKEQSKNVQSVDKAAIQRQMCDIARKLKEELQNNQVDAMGELLHENWMLKRSLAAGITNPLIDETYEVAMKAGATGGKLLGAGGAGFMLFYVPEEKHDAVRNALCNLREMDFEIDNSGATIVMTDRDFV